MRLRAAIDADVDVLLRWRRAAAAWLTTLGSDQWQKDYPSPQGMIDRMTASIQAGETWMVDQDDGQPIATITINHASDDGLWTKSELDTALFAHRMMLDRTHAGRGIGAELLDLAGEQAQHHGCDWIRLDCWTTNHALHHYYRTHGFHHVRTVQGHYTGSAACFQRPAALRTATGLFTTSQPDLTTPHPRCDFPSASSTIPQPDHR